MQKLTLSLAFAVLIPLLICGGENHAQTEFEYQPKIDALVQPYLESNKFKAVSIAVLADQKSWIGNYGELSDEDSAKPDGNTVFEVGSISKVFTSLLLADAVNRGLVELDTPIGALIPELEETEIGNSITLKHLSTHTSGLPKMPDNNAPKDPENPFADYDRKLLIEYLKSARPDHKPGEKYDYSNLGAGLLGGILASKSGQDYESLLRERVLTPLQMNDTALKLSPDQAKRFAPPHNSALLKDKAWDFKALAGAGAIRSTTNDMLKFMKAQIDVPEGEIGRAIDLAWKEQLPAQDGHRAMGLGWLIAGDGSTRWHNGQTGGYQSMMLVSRDLKAGVILLSNTAGSEVDGLAETIFQAAVGMNVQPRQFVKAVDVDEKTVKRLVGKYQLAPGIIIEVVNRKDRMVAKLTGQTFLKIVPKSETVWSYTDVEAELHFELPERGKAAKVTLHQNGREMPAARVK